MGQDSGFIWVEENRVIMCDPKYTLIDFETEYELTEDEVSHWNMQKALSRMVSFMRPQQELKENTTMQTDYSEIC